MYSRWLRITAILAAGSACAAACADNNSSLFIRSNLAVVPPACTVRADPASASILDAQLDVAFNQQYIATLLVGNQMANRGLKARLRAETMRVTLRGAEVTLTDLNGDQIVPPFSVPGSGTVDSVTSDTPGYGIMDAEVIPSSVGVKILQKLRAQGPGSVETVIADIRVFGDTLGNESIESSLFTLPIKTCYGCSVVFPFTALDPPPQGSPVPEGTNYICDKTGDTTSQAACRPGQDSLISCFDCVKVKPEVCLYASAP